MTNLATAPATESITDPTGILPVGPYFMWTTLLCVLIVWATAIWLATAQPWLGITLVADAPLPEIAQTTGSPPALQSEPLGLRIESVDSTGPAKAIVPGARLLAVQSAGGTNLQLKATDLIEEPDMFGTYAEWKDFYLRQYQLVQAMQSGPVQLGVKNTDGSLQSIRVQAASSRPISALPAVFWFQLFVGGFAALVGAWVFSVRREDWSVRCLALTAYGLLLSAGSASVYSSRELALEPGLFHLLSGGNHSGAMIFGVGLVGIFMFHPHRVCSLRWFVGVLAVFFVWNLADVMWWLPATDWGNRLIILSLLLISIGLGIKQWRLSRGRLADRAALLWVLLSFLVGAGTFTALIVCSVLLGLIAPISQGYAFGLFLSMYIGLALGVRRYRLFDLDVWSLRTLMWLFGVLGIVLLDALLISQLHWNTTTSLAVSILVCAALYFPLRQWLWDRVFRRKEASLEALAADIASLALAPAERLLHHHQKLFSSLFSPTRFSVEQTAMAYNDQNIQILDHGMGLHIPAVVNLPAMQLWQRDQGRKLFSTRDVQTAKRLHDLISIVVKTRDAYQHGASAERERIAGDLHDDLGARLLSIVHGSTQGHSHMQLASVARMALDDLRLTVRELTGQPLPASITLADWRAETMNRLEQAHIQAHWSAQDPPQELQLPVRLQAQFTRVLRETLSNVIRHSQAKQCFIEIVIARERIELRVGDDGTGFTPHTASPNTKGYGLTNIERRMQLLGGSYTVSSSEWGGVLVQAQAPLPSAVNVQATVS